MYIMFLFIDEGGGKLVMRISIIKNDSDFIFYDSKAKPS